MPDSQLCAKLRAATEDDVQAALRGSYVAEVDGVGCDKLLEVWNLMLDRMLGPDDC